MIERSYPVSPAFMGICKVNQHWAFLLGIGEEFAKERNLTLTRAGTEYGAEISNNWEILGTVNYDFKWNAYDSWGIGIGVVRKIGK